MIDDRIGNDSNMGAGRDAFADKIGAMARRLKDRPVKLQAFLAGLGHQAVLTRPGVASALAPFLKLPPPEARTQKRARMAKLISELFAANGQVTDTDLLGAGFSKSDIATLKDEAGRIAGVARMAA